MTIESIAQYLGKPASEMLRDPPFRSWPMEQTYEDDLDEPTTTYEFSQHGMEIVCYGDERIGCIFLKSDKFDESLIDIPFALSRHQVVQRFGRPSRSGSKFFDESLGERGAWDRFDGPEYALHFRYWPTKDRIEMITLMRPDVAP